MMPGMCRSDHLFRQFLASWCHKRSWVWWQRCNSRQVICQSGTSSNMVGCRGLEPLDFTLSCSELRKKNPRTFTADLRPPKLQVTFSSPGRYLQEDNFASCWFHPRIFPLAEAKVDGLGSVTPPLQILCVLRGLSGWEQLVSFRPEGHECDTQLGANNVHPLDDVTYDTYAVWQRHCGTMRYTIWIYIIYICYNMLQWSSWEMC
jgi:hypothetical protein